MNYGIKNNFSKIIYAAVLLFFVFVIFLPAVYVFSFAASGKLAVSGELFEALWVNSTFKLFFT